MANKGTPKKLNVGCDNIYQVAKLRNALTGQFANNGVVQMTLKDLNGNNVTAGGNSFPWPVTLQYIANSDGLYQGTLPATLDVVEQVYYKLVIYLNAGGFELTTEDDCIGTVKQVRLQ